MAKKAEVSHFCYVCGKVTKWQLEKKHSGNRERRTCQSCHVTLTVTVK